jgi:hypothetical protein
MVFKPLDPPQEAPVAPQHFLSLLPAFSGTAQARFVSFVQHCKFVVHGALSSKGSQTGHFFLRFFFLASASPVYEAISMAATADATEAPMAERIARRRVLALLASRVRVSNAEPSMIFSGFDRAIVHHRLLPQKIASDDQSATTSCRSRPNR